MANVTDKIVSAAPVWTGQLASSIPDGTTTSFSLTSSSGLTDGEVYYFTIDRVDASGNKTPAKKEVIKGKLNGTNVVDCIRGVEGTAQAHSSGATVEIIWTAAQWNSLKSHITTEHNQDGTHDSTKVTTRTAFETEHKTDNTHDETKVAMLAGAQTFTGQKTFSSGIKTDTIDEKTTDTGVTIDGLLIKDGNAAKATTLSTSCKFLVTLSADQTITSGSWQRINFNSEIYDVGNNFDNSTNYRFTAPVTGYYLISVQVRVQSIAASGSCRFFIYKKGSGLTESPTIFISAGQDRPGITSSIMLNLAANDYLEIYFYQNTGSNLSIAYGQANTFFCGHLVST